MRRTTLTVLALTVVLLAGCSDEGDPQATPSGTPDSSSTTEPTEPGTTEPGTTEPTETEPAVEPAGGFLMDLDRIRMRAPDGWKRNDPLSTFLLQADDRDTVSSVALSDLESLGDYPLRGQAKIALESFDGAKILDNVEIAGVEWYHIGGRADDRSSIQQFGTIHNGSEAVIDFSFSDDIPAEEQQRIVDSVLATVEWK